MPKDDPVTDGGRGTILIVEDDALLGETLSSRLTEEGFLVKLVNGFKTATIAFKESSFDLAILDIGLPDGDGFSLAQTIKVKNTPIIFLTARSTAEDRLMGFTLGAEDFIPKPFLLQELLLRMDKILKREFSKTDKRSQIKAQIKAQIKVGEILIDTLGRALLLPNHRKDFLTEKDFQVLLFLINSYPLSVSREELLQRFWNNDKEITQRTVDNLILRLRIHLQEYGDRYIRSVRGKGYQWTIAPNLYD